ncbi:MAG: hypothetical protein IVW56_13330 [Candidatus Binataceae bacterium]|nr:hypothetical protein [Candidatus Binataceae bacterium]
MNCFEAQKMFAPFWRRTLSVADRAAFSDHLGACQRCDRAFRVFALSAPVLHGHAEPAAGSAGSPIDPVRTYRAAARRLAPSVQIAPSATRPWAVAAAAALMLLVGGFSAWSVTAWPAPDFTAAVAGEDTDVTPVSYHAGGLDSDAENADSVPSLFDSMAPDAGAGTDDRAG